MIRRQLSFFVETFHHQHLVFSVVMPITASFRKIPGSSSTKRSELDSSIQRFTKEHRWDFQELERNDIQLIGVKTGRQCKMYFYCKPDSALSKLIEMLSARRLDDIVQGRINSLLKTKDITVAFTCRSGDYDQCKQYFPREVGR